MPLCSHRDAAVCRSEWNAPQGAPAVVIPGLSQRCALRALCGVPLRAANTKSASELNGEASRCVVRSRATVALMGTSRTDRRDLVLSIFASRSRWLTRTRRSLVSTLPQVSPRASLMRTPVSARGTTSRRCQPSGVAATSAASWVASSAFTSRTSSSAPGEARAEGLPPGLTHALTTGCSRRCRWNRHRGQTP